MSTQSSSTICTQCGADDLMIMVCKFKVCGDCTKQNYLKAVQIKASKQKKWGNR